MNIIVTKMLSININIKKHFELIVHSEVKFISCESVGIWCDDGQFRWHTRHQSLQRILEITR